MGRSARAGLTLAIALTGCQWLVGTEDRVAATAPAGGDAGVDASAGSGGDAGTAGAAGTSGTGGAAGVSGSAGVGGTSGASGAGASGASGVGGGAGASGAAGIGGAAGSAGACGSVFIGGVWPDSTPICSDGTSGGACPIAGEDASHVGQLAAYEDCDDAVFDQVTGLTWEKTPPWTNGNAPAHSAAVQHCKDLGADWRLPTLFELTSIMDYGLHDPIAPTAFFSQQGGYGYWSTSQYRNQVSTHWGLNVMQGFSTWLADGVALNTNARCVKGAISGALSVSSGPPQTVIDTRTGLAWQLQTSTATFTWQSAIDHCETMTDAGAPWRLASVKELLTILDTAATSSPALPSQFTAEPGVQYWSSTPVRGSPGQSWRVDFSASEILVGASGSEAQGTPLRARCVRDAP